MKRRDFIKIGLGSAALLTSGGAMLTSTALGPKRAYASDFGIGLTEEESEPMPLSPFIMDPFSEPLPIPQPLAPVTPEELATWSILPSQGQQDCDGATHQLWPDQLKLPDPIIYNLKMQVAGHSFTSSKVRTLVDYEDDDGNLIPAGTEIPSLPQSTIYGFNGQFPGPMIRAFYGQPALVRIENFLDENPEGLDRGDFGIETFLTHLHNGHTASESDGNPNHEPHAYEPGDWCDNLYLNWPAGGDDREKQSFMWYHDHTHSNTSANVYKGMVGLYPIYDKMDNGDETKGYRLPGYEYDIPLAIYDCSLDDGITEHRGIGQDGHEHPDNWGKLFFAHYANHGFVGDVFTVNGKVQPYLVVKRRKYRFRFLDCSIARIYELSLMSGALRPAPGVQGQWLLSGAQQVMRMNQIASEGGLLPRPLVRDSFVLAPAKRREFVVDFTQYMDGSPTRSGDVIYLTNTLKMTDGRKPDESQSSDYAVPLMKIIIDGDPPTPDRSIVPSSLRSLPPLPTRNALRKLTYREFELHRSESEWLINGRPFDPTRPIAFPRKDTAEIWVLRNGGSGWVHPMHLHEEEHQIISRNGHPPPTEDQSKEDVVLLAENEEVAVYRQFRSFTGKYVAHCHNLAHEDHAMMFAWNIVP